MIVLTAFAGLLALTLQASPPVHVIGANSAEECYRGAQRDGAFRADIQSCLTALEDVGMSTDDRAATYVNLGILMRRRGNLEAAIEAYDRAIELRPRLAEAWLNRGAARLAQGEARRAIEDLDRALRLEPARPEYALINRAAALEALGETEAAYADLRAALEIAPDFAPVGDMLQRYGVRQASDTPG